MSRVAITGLGLISCLGHDLSTVTEHLRTGTSGLISDPKRLDLGFRSPLTGALPPFDAKALLPRKARRSMNEPALYAAIAATRAIHHAALPPSLLASDRVGVITGNDSCVQSGYLAASQTLADGTTQKLGSTAVVKCMNSAPSINLSVLLGTRGASWTLSGACASGAHAIGQAAMLIKSGQQDVVITGGVQELHWSSMAGFDGQGSFSSFKGDPSKASRPFSSDRDGLVPSGGGAMIVLESEAHARQRGATIHGFLRAYAFSSDGSHVTTPSGLGAERAIRRVLALGETRASEIHYINAHATGTPLGDAAEAKALLAVFGEGGPPISSTKALTGHECWMAGASELIYCLLMSRAGFLCANHNLSPVEAFAGLNLLQENAPHGAQLMLSNSFGFGGTNATLLIEGAPQ